MVALLQVVIYFLALLCFLSVCQMYVTSAGLRRLRNPPEEGSSWPVGILVALTVCAIVGLVVLSETMAAELSRLMSGLGQ